MQKLAINGIDLAYDVHGSGDPFFLVHGFTGSSVDWADVVDELAADRQVIVLDHRGHGESTNTGDKSSYTFDQLVDDFAGLADHLGLDRFDLLGHSMGGMVAMRYALRQPDRLRSLILMDTAAAPANERNDFFEAGIKMVDENGMSAIWSVMEQFIGSTEVADRSCSVDELRARNKRKNDQMDPAAFVALGRGLFEYDSVLDDLASLTMPTTVICGTGDVGLAPASEEMARVIPGAELVWIEGAGHSPQEENKSAWLAAVKAHLARVERCADRFLP